MPLSPYWFQISLAERIRWWEISHMTNLVTADEKGRIPIRGSEPGRKYLVTQTGSEWRVTAFSSGGIMSRNRREWSGPKAGKKGLFDSLKEMGDLGLKLEVSESGKKPVPPCPF
jgi:hypothetical protein